MSLLNYVIFSVHTTICAEHLIFGNKISLNISQVCQISLTTEVLLNSKKYSCMREHHYLVITVMSETYIVTTGNEEQQVTSNSNM